MRVGSAYAAVGDDVPQRPVGGRDCDHTSPVRACLTTFAIASAITNHAAALDPPRGTAGRLLRSRPGPGAARRVHDRRYQAATGERGRLEAGGEVAQLLDGLPEVDDRAVHRRG